MTDSTLHKIRALLATPEPPGLGPGPRPGIAPAATLEDALKDIFTGSVLAPETRDSIRALVLLWHDRFDAAHRVVERLEDLDSGLVHGILHRREPDFSNARYWFRFTGKHPCFPEICRRVTVYLDSRGDKQLRGKLMPKKGEWESLAFVDLCEAMKKNPVPEQVELLREIQRIEMEKLLEYLQTPRERPRPKIAGSRSLWE